MDKHVLIKKAFIYEESRKNQEMDGCEFDKSKGYWVDKLSRKACITDEAFAKPQTKKADIETGEDQKGE